jgi:hypothetical protein
VLSFLEEVYGSNDMMMMLASLTFRYACQKGLPKCRDKTAGNALNKALHMFNQEPLHCSSRRQFCIQLNVDTISIFGFDKTTIPLEGTIDDDYSPTFPNATVHGPGQKSSLDTRYHQVILFDINLKPS